MAASTGMRRRPGPRALHHVRARRGVGEPEIDWSMRRGRCGHRQARRRPCCLKQRRHRRITRRRVGRIHTTGEHPIRGFVVQSNRPHGKEERTQAHERYTAPSGPGSAASSRARRRNARCWITRDGPGRATGELGDLLSAVPAEHAEQDHLGLRTGRRLMRATAPATSSSRSGSTAGRSSSKAPGGRRTTHRCHHRRR